MRKFAAVGKGGLNGRPNTEGWNSEFQNISRNSKLFTLKFVHRDRVQIFLN